MYFLQEVWGGRYIGWDELICPFEICLEIYIDRIIS